MNFAKVFGILFAAAAILGGGYVLTLFSPGAAVEDSSAYLNSDMENSQLLLESEKLEKSFEKQVVQKGTTEEVVALLRKAISLQEVYIDRSSNRDRSPAERLVKLKTRLQNIEAKPLLEIVDSLEKKAKDAAAAEDSERARDYYSQACVMQTKINVDYSLSKFKSVQRALYFDTQSKTMRARPLYLKSVEAEKNAYKAIEAGNWNSARENFETAIAMLSKINSDFPNSAYTDFTRMQNLDVELESLKSADLYAKLEAVLKKAEDAKARNDFPSASEAYGDALELQRTINRVYPRSRHASDESAAKFEREKIDAYSWDYATAIKNLDAKLTEVIRKGDIPLVVEMSTNLLGKVEQFKRDYPRSNLVGDELVLKLRYINFTAREIPQIQRLVRENLAEINGVQMLATEVTQKLYSAVMKENPSRYTDNENLPVDSVSYDDVERFCTRLSWILSAEVALPTEADFAKAVGSLRYVDINEISWNYLNSGGKTHPVAAKRKNDKGFFDLLGNVEEFVRPKSGSDSIPVMGGSAQSTTDSILDLAKKTVDSKTRNRMLGFRIIVK